MPAASRHPSRQPTETTPPATSRSAAAQVLKAAAHDAYRASVASGTPLTGAELGKIFDRSATWGTARVREVRDADIGRSQGTTQPLPSNSNGAHRLPIRSTGQHPAANSNGSGDAGDHPLPIGSNGDKDPDKAPPPVGSKGDHATAIGSDGYASLPIDNGTSTRRSSIDSTGDHPRRLDRVTMAPDREAAFPRPVALRPRRPINRRSEVPTSLIVVMVVAVAIVAVVTMVTSYTHTHDLAKLAGWPRWLAKILPAAVDGLVVAGSASLMVDRRIRGRDSHGHPLAWAAVAIGLVSSLAANVVAVDPTLVDMRAVRWVMAGYAPLALGISGHLLLRMLGERRPRPMDTNVIAHVIDTYDATIRSNSTADYDAVHAVVNNSDGEVGWKVVQTARDLGYELDELDVDALFEAVEGYRSRLVAEVASRQ